MGEKIAKILRTTCDPSQLEVNLHVGRMLFEHARGSGYEASEAHPQVFRYGRGEAPIGLDFYLTQGERLIFQFPHFRVEPLNEQQCCAMASIIHHAYAVGDFADAETEIVQFSVPHGKERVTQLVPVARGQLLDRKSLNAEIDDVYAVLRVLAENPDA